MKYNLIIRITVIILGILVGFSIFQLIIVPLLQSKCIIKTNSCVKIQYQKYENSVLVHMIPTGYWIFFDGNDVFIYGEPAGKVCDDEHEPVYVYDVENMKDTGYVCGTKLAEIKDFYDKNKSLKKYVYLRRDTSDFGVYDVINYLADNRIINITPSKIVKSMAASTKTPEVDLSGVLGKWG